MIDYKIHLLKFINNLIELPKNPKQAADLITRARILLGRRKNEEVEALDNNINFIIDDFSEMLKKEHGGNYNRHMATVLNIHTDIELLKHCLSEYNFEGISDTQAKVAMCDYFAVYGVRHVAMAHILITSQPPKGLEDNERDVFRKEQEKQAFDLIYTALDCISYARQLKETESIVYELKQLKDNQQNEINKQVKREISQSKSLAAKKSHAKDYKEKKKVMDWLCENEDVQKIMYKTNNKIAEDLVKLDIFTVSFTTLLKYISAYKNERLEQLSIKTKRA